jgi:AraC-like DNA-binding protein
MNKLYYFLFLLIIIQINAQDTLAKYTPEQLGYKSSMATRLKDKPLLWKVYFDAMIERNPTNALKINTYYNLSWDIFSYTDYDLDLSIQMMKKAIYYGQKSHSNEALLYSYDALGEFYAVKNDNRNALKCVEKIKQLHNPDSVNELSYLKFSGHRIFYWLGDFERATTILLTANKNIDVYVSKHSQLSKKEFVNLVYDNKKSNYIGLVHCYNYRKKLDSSAYYIKKIREIEKKGYLFHNNYDWIEEAFYLVLSKKYDLAIQYIADSEKKGFIDSKDKRCRANYYLALCWEQKKNYAKSLELCEQALNIHARFCSFINYDLELSKLAASNASKIGNSIKEAYYSKKYNDISQKTDYTAKAKFITKLYEQDVTEAREKLQSEKTKTSYSYCIALISFLLSCSITTYFLKVNKARKKFENIISAAENAAPQNNLKEIDKALEHLESTQSNTTYRKPVKMSLETDEKIEKQLSNFEKKERFLSPNTSLSNMASEFNTNSAYLSAVIKKHKNKNFNAYINDLRIDYIIKKLKTSPEYLNYKIAYLAEECGFSSHTVFIRIFTEKTGLTPSKFIDILKNENR